MLIFKEFSFDSAHYLPKVPASHKCREMHGHTYRLIVFLEGNPNIDTGWIIDFSTLKKSVNNTLALIDHKCLNNIPGLENPTCELLAIWIWNRLKKELPLLTKVKLYETSTAGVLYNRT